MDITARGDDAVFRASELDTATRCPRQLGYLRLGVAGPDGTPTGKLPMKPSWALLAGTAMDTTMNEHNLEKIHGRNGLRGSALQDYYVTELRKEERKALEVGASPEADDEGGRQDAETDGVRVLPLYESELSPQIEPVAVQAFVETTISLGSLGDVKLVGHIDLIRTAGANGAPSHRIIDDYKFTKKTPGQMPARLYARGWAYDLMAGDGSGHIGLIYLRRGLKSPKVETDSHFVTDAERAQVRLQTAQVVSMYRARFFPMTSPDNWWCSAKFCGWHALCRGNPNGPAPIHGEAVPPVRL